MTFTEIARIEFNRDCREARSFNDYEDEPCKCAGCKEQMSDFGKPHHHSWHWDCARGAFTYQLGIIFIEVNGLIDEFMAWLPREYWATTWFDFVGSMHLEATYMWPPRARAYLRDYCLEHMDTWIEFLETRED